MFGWRSITNWSITSTVSVFQNWQRQTIPDTCHVIRNGPPLAENVNPEMYNLIVIGAGPGGHVAAIRAAQLGMNGAVVEKRPTLGGTCLNVGCIPSKAMLDSSELYYLAKEKFAVHGIETGDRQVNLKQMVGREQDVVDATVDGIDYLFKKNGISRYQGHGRFADAHTVAIEQDGGTKALQTEHVIIATGSETTPRCGRQPSTVSAL